MTAAPGRRGPAGGAVTDGAPPGKPASPGARYGRPDDADAAALSAGDPAGLRPVAGTAAGPSAGDIAVIAAQLGRPPRGTLAVAHRCPCGLPDVVKTAPWLPDGTPFPTLYYLTCPRASAAMSRLEAAGLMREMTQRLAGDPGLRQEQQAAHREYLARRDAAAVAAGTRPLPPGTVSAGGMPDRVKCLHALAAHELACPGANALGREAIQAAGKWWAAGPCVAGPDSAGQPAAGQPAAGSLAAGSPAAGSSAAGSPADGQLAAGQSAAGSSAGP
jgi:hypothetical protein